MFKMPHNTALLVFDGDYEGAEVRCRLDVGMRTAFSFFQARELSDPKDLIEMVERFCEQVLIDWNLVDDNDQPIPCTAEAMLDQPAGFIRAVIANWHEAATAVPKASPAPSLNGSTLPEGFVLTEPS